jgi:hypothetical protein
MQPLPRFGRDSAPWFQAQVPVERGRLPPAFRNLRRFLPAPLTFRLEACDTSSSPASPGTVLGLHEPPGHQPRSRRFSPERRRLSSRRLSIPRPCTPFRDPRGPSRRSSRFVASRLLRSASYPPDTLPTVRNPDHHQHSRVFQPLERWLSALASTRCRVGPVTELIAVTQWPPQSAGYL